MLSTQRLPFRIIAIDPIAARREKMLAAYTKICGSDRISGDFVANSIDQSRETVKEWTKGIGCMSVLEVSTSITTIIYG
jgi:hypothetical protein